MSPEEKEKEKSENSISEPAVEKDIELDNNAENEEESKEVNKNLKWYVIHVYTGYEKRVGKYIDGLLTKKYAERVGKVLIPTLDVSSTRRGKKTTRKKTLYPGYVFVQLELDDEMVMDIRAMTNVSGFPPMNKEYPTQLEEEEVSRLKGQVDSSEKAKVYRISFRVGQMVRVTEGPFKNFSGVVESINPDRGRVRVIVTVLGRQAPIEIDFSHVRTV